MAQTKAQLISGASSQSVTFNDATVSSINGGPIGGARNRIINGDMRIDQRNAGAALTLTGGYNIDRWRSDTTGGASFTVQRNAGSVTPPTGYTNYLGYTSTAAYTPAANSTFCPAQAIEGFNCADLAWGTASAATVTLSFWVRSSINGTHSGSLTNGGGTRSYVFSFTVNSANTWEYKTVTISGDTTGTWATDNTSGISVRFNLGTGTGTFGSTSTGWQAGNIVGLTSAVQVSATNGATFYITGVQLEAGSTATPFERRSYGQELALCQRYYEKSYEQSVVPGSATGSGYSLGCVNTNASTTYYSTNIDKFAVVKRAAPTMRFWDIAGNLNRVSSYTLGALARTDNSNSIYSYAGFQQNAVMIDTRSAGTMAGYQWEASAEL